MRATVKRSDLGILHAIATIQRHVEYVMWNAFELLWDISIEILCGGSLSWKTVWWFIYLLSVVILSLEFGVLGFLGGLGLFFVFYQIAKT